MLENELMDVAEATQWTADTLVHKEMWAFRAGDRRALAEAKTEMTRLPRD
jgi:hypothetical protein